MSKLNASTLKRLLAVGPFGSLNEYEGLTGWTRRGLTHDLS